MHRDLQSIRETRELCLGELSSLQKEKQEFHSAEKVNKNERLLQEIEQRDAEVSEGQAMMERIEDAIREEELEVGQIESRIRQIQTMLADASNNEWESYKRGIVR